MTILHWSQPTGNIAKSITSSMFAPPSALKLGHISCWSVGTKSFFLSFFWWFPPLQLDLNPLAGPCGGNIMLPWMK